ncbi:ankyrin-3 [Biomphalaria glabrata]|nr:ankyrin-3-like; partial [Biomphalaria glabrata]KAI8796893.1 ankyrin-3 [Biomphalaria glabrata]
MAASEDHRKHLCDLKPDQLNGEIKSVSLESDLLELVLNGNINELIEKWNFIQRNLDIAAAFLKSAELGNKRIVQIFIENGADINSTNILGNTALHIAAQHGFFDLVKILVRNGAKVNEQNLNGDTALMLGVRSACSLPLIEYLLCDESVANVNLQNYLGKTALMIAIEQHDFSAMKLLLSHKEILLGLKDTNGRTAYDIAKDLRLGELFSIFESCRVKLVNPLFLAIKQNSVALIRSVLYTLGKEEVNTLDDSGFSPLMVSLKGKNVNMEIISMLLKAGADVNAGSPVDNLTPLFLACKAGCLQAVKLLVKEGADVNSQTTSKLTPLMWASQYPTGITEFLIDNKANVNFKNNNGETALMFSLRQWNKTCFELLIKNGAEINDAAFSLTVNMKWYKMLDKGNLVVSKNVLNKTFLSACKENDLKLAEFLLENGAEVNHIGNNKAIPLALALGNVKLVNLLISYGADVNLKTKSGSCPLIKAVKLDDCQALEILIKEGADLNAVNSKGYTALMVAAQKEKLHVMNILLENGADVNYMSTTNGHLSALNVALSNDKTESVSLLLSRGAFVNQIANSPLKQALSGDPKNMELCLKYGADPNTRFSDGSTVLMLAISSQCDHSKIKLLLDFGADTNITNNKGESALILAARHSPTIILELLIQNGADINIEDEHGSSVLLQTLPYSSSDYNKIALLIDSGANVNSRNQMGDTPLLVAAQCSNVNIMRLLVAKGANVNVQDQGGYTPLMHAVITGSYEKLKFLIDCNANLELQSFSGMTALIVAACRQPRMLNYTVAGACFIIKLLLDKGANLNAQDQRGFTALMHAVIDRCYEKVNVLIQYKADLNIKSFGGHTAVLLATSQGNTAILEALLDAGASVNIENDNGDSVVRLLLPHLYSWSPHTLPTNWLICFKLLLAAGAKVDLKNPNNALLFHKLIVFYDEPELIDLFINTGAAPTAISLAALRDICTIPSHYTFCDNIEIVSPLLTAMFAKNNNLVSCFLKCLYLHKSDVSLSQNKGLHYRVYRENTSALSAIVPNIPFSLSCLSFLAVSTAVGNGLDRKSRIDSLPIPTVIKNSLLFLTHKHCVPDNKVKEYTQRVDFQNYTQQGLLGLDIAD